MLSPIDLIRFIQSRKFDLQDEKILQRQIASHLGHLNVSREYRLDDKNIPDFFVDGIAIEVKIKGNRMDIYRQCERYALFEEVKSIILLTNRAIGFPDSLNGKPVYVLNLGKAWL